MIHAWKRTPRRNEHNMTNDNEPNRWTSIGWQSLLILNKLKTQRALREHLHDAVADAEDDKGREDAANTETARRELFVAVK